jgi:hypothetical protein
MTDNTDSVLNQQRIESADSLTDKDLKNPIPYTIFVFSNFKGASIQYGSTTEDKLTQVLTDILSECICDFDFDVTKDYTDSDLYDSDDDNENKYTSSSIVSNSELTCDVCWCCVVNKKYITVIDNKRFCGGCNPVNNVLNKKLFDNFKLYLKMSKEKCDIIYFKDGNWHDFVIV